MLAHVKLDFNFYTNLVDKNHIEFQGLNFGEMDIWIWTKAQGNQS